MADHRYPLRSRSRIQPHNFKSRAVDYILAQHLFEVHMHSYKPAINHVYKPNGSKETIDTVCTGTNKRMWLQSLSNEWGRLAQGNDRGVHFNDVIEFISQK